MYNKLIYLNVIFGEIMNRMWENIILPIINFKNIKYIVEIGVDEGINTKNILNYCIENNAKLVSIDPNPNFDEILFQKEYGDCFTFFKEMSLVRLPYLEDYDCILIDGDHNWYTVFHELQNISKKFNQNNFPLIFLHDVSWPYGRRDLYYNPDDIPSDYQNDYSKLGMHPDSEDLLPEYGLNTNLFNANKENTPKNGVLTAIEDFLNECQLDLEFHFVPIFFGLGILHKKDDELYEFIEKTVYNEDILSLVELYYIRSDINKSIKFLKQMKYCKQLSEKNAQNDTEIKNLTQELEKNIKRLSEIEGELSNKNTQLTDLRQKNLNLTDENNLQKQYVLDLKSQIDKLDNEFNIKNDILDSINKTNKQLTKTNELHLNEINDLNKKLNDSYDNLANTKLELIKSKYSINETIIKHASLNGIYKDQSDEILQLKEDNNNLMNLSENFPRDGSDFEITMDDEIYRLKNHFIKSDKKVQDFKVKYSETTFGLNQEKRKSKILLNQKMSLNNKIGIMQDEFESLNNDLSNSEELISDLKELLDEKQDELDYLNEIYQNTVKMKYNLEQENAYLKNLNRNLMLKTNDQTK